MLFRLFTRCLGTGDKRLLNDRNVVNARGGDRTRVCVRRCDTACSARTSRDLSSLTPSPYVHPVIMRMVNYGAGRSRERRAACVYICICYAAHYSPAGLAIFAAAGVARAAAACVY